jgi:hypothetical protein
MTEQARQALGEADSLRDERCCPVERRVLVEVIMVVRVTVIVMVVVDVVVGGDAKVLSMMRVESAGAVLRQIRC